MKKTLEELQATDFPSKKRKRKRKSITKYHPEKALEIIQRVSEGQTLRRICNPEKGMPSMTTFLRWVAQMPDLRNAFEAAKAMSALVMEEEAIDMARDATQQSLNQNALRALTLAIDQLRWSATRRDPKNYSDKGNQAIVVPVHITSSLDLGGQDGSAGNGTAEYPDIYALKAVVEKKEDIIDGDFKEVTPENHKVDSDTGIVSIFDPDTMRNELRKEVSAKWEDRRAKWNAAAQRRRDEEKAKREGSSE